MINGDYQSYDWDTGELKLKENLKEFFVFIFLGYTCHQIGSGGIVIQLSQPYIISSMR